MTSEQRSLAGYKSQVHEQQDFENPNEGKPPLNDSTEYVFRLISFPRVITASQIKEKKDGIRVTVKVDKAVCEFEEEGSGNIVNAFFRVDSLNFSEEEAFESGVVRFFKKIKTPLVEGEIPEWDRYFIVGMRFRGRVAIGKDDEKVPNGKYFLDVPTCRPILQSDKHPESVSAPTIQNAQKPDAKASSLANAMLIVHGCADRATALKRLDDAKVTSDVILAFIEADGANKITYPC